MEELKKIVDIILEKPKENIRDEFCKVDWIKFLTVEKNCTCFNKEAGWNFEYSNRVFKYTSLSQMLKNDI